MTMLARPLLALRFAAIIVCFAASLSSADTNDADRTVTSSVDSEQSPALLVERLLAAGLISNEVHSRQLALLKRTATSQRAVAAASTGSANVSPRTSSPGISSTDSGRYVALVIGSNDYHNFEPLQTAVNDARAIGQLLESEFGFDVELVLNPTRRELISSIMRYRETLRTEDHFLLYYAGHGYLEETTQRGYWLPVDAETENPSNWVSNVEIADAMNSLSASHVLVITDSCYSGSLAVAEPEPVSSNDHPDVAHSRSRLVISSGGLEPVLDGGFGRHSVFAQALLDELATFDNTTSLTALFQRVRRSVLQQASQVPVFSAMQHAGHHGGMFPLRRNESS